MDTLNLKPLTDEWQDVDASRVPADLDWHTPPACRGQIVVRSYAADETAAYLKQYDQSDRTTGYCARLLDGNDEPFEPWNYEPR